MDFGKRRSVTSGGKNIFDFSKMDGQVNFFKLKVGVNKIDILPYKVSSKNHPLVAKGNLEKGDYDYNLDIYVHRRIGPGDASFVCLKRNYGKECPICDIADQFKEQGRDKEAMAFYPARRIYYSVVDANDREKGVQLFETNHKFFEKPLKAVSDAYDEGGPNTFFASIDDGLTLKVIASENTFEGNKFVQADSISLTKRKESVEEFAGEVIELDKYIVVPIAEEISAVLNGVEEEEEETPKVKKPSHDDDDEDTPPKVKKPAKEEEPSKHETEDECPHNLRWGIDNGEKPECDECPIGTYKKCAKAAKNG